MTTLDKRQSATILAALRTMQQVRGECYGGELPEDIDSIRTNGDTLQPLEDDEIDALCEQINVAPDPAIIVVGCEGGLIQGASSNIDGLSMIVLDYDTEGCGDDEITEVPQSDTVELEPAIVGLHTVAHDAPWIQQICDAVGVKGLREQINIATPESSELLEWCKQLREEIGGMGFDDPDQSVDGSDAVEYLGKLYDDLGQMVAA
jgi:hypothetical protein